MKRRSLRSMLTLATILIATSGIMAADAEHGAEEGEHLAAPAPSSQVEVAPDLDFYWGGYWGAPIWYDPLWYGPPYYDPGYLPVTPRNQSSVVVHARPSRADVYLDGTLLGRARDFDSVWNPLLMKPGEHELELAYPGYQRLKLALDTQRGMSYTLHERLHKGQGTDPRSSDIAGASEQGEGQG